MPTLLEVAKSNGVEAVIDEASRSVPELSVIPSFPMAGVTVESLVYTGSSNTTGSFRKVGGGTANITVQSENRSFTCYTIEPRIEVDRAAADRHEGGAQAYIGARSRVILNAEFMALARQMYYGTANNADGFPGLISSYNAASMTVDATGTTAGAGSSVWALRIAPPNDPDNDGVRWRFGQGGRMAFDPVMMETITQTGDASKKYKAYTTSFTAYPGVQIQNLLTVARIKNLTAQANKTLNDALLNQLLTLFPEGQGPNLILMNRRSALQLQSSRTPTTTTGASAPWVTSILGMDGEQIPIRLTQAISSTETIG
jgi:hypothetical protein